jgi:predicted RNase H-like nuclease
MTIMSPPCVLGIDAAWTLTQPSGVALVQAHGDGWRLVDVAASYADYAAGHSSRAPASAAALLEASEVRCGQRPAVVAIDMPLALTAIVARREADNAVSREYGARYCSTHSPSAIRPGPVSDGLRAGFADLGYRLAVMEVSAPALIEVYPHPALLELTGAPSRLPYKAGKLRSYWKALAPRERRAQLIATWRDILQALDAEIEGVLSALPLPAADAPVRALKSFEDKLDAVVCAWCGICALEGRARPLGDDTASVWIPLGRIKGGLSARPEGGES